MKIHLLYFAGCPNLESAREALGRVFAGGRSGVTVHEIDTSAPDAPEHLRAWGSPTILVNGVDVVGGQPEGQSCRLYVGGAFRGVPSDEQIRAAIKRTRQFQ